MRFAVIFHANEIRPGPTTVVSSALVPPCATSPLCRQNPSARELSATANQGASAPSDHGSGLPVPLSPASPRVSTCSSTVRGRSAGIAIVPADESTKTPSASPNRTYKNGRTAGAKANTADSPSFRNQPLPGPDGTASPDTAHSIHTFVSQSHAIDESSSIRTSTVLPVPDAGTLPVPVQPEQTTCSPFSSRSGETAVAVTWSPWEYKCVPGPGDASPIGVETASESFRSVNVARIVRGASAGT